MASCPTRSRQARWLRMESSRRSTRRWGCRPDRRGVRGGGGDPIDALGGRNGLLSYEVAAGSMAKNGKFAPVDEQMELLSRGAVDLVDEAQLRAKLARSARSGEPLTVKTGFDPSSPDLHLGHTVLLRKMRHFQQLGHRVIFLIGDFTALIGDPTGKKTTRPQLSPEEVEVNAQTYKRQVWKVLDERATVVEHHSRWLLAVRSGGPWRP